MLPAPNIRLQLIHLKMDGSQLRPADRTNILYSGDLKNRNIWITNFYMSGIQMSGIQMFGIQMVVQYSDHHLNTGPVFKWCSEHRTKFCPVFKWHLSNRPFGDQTTFDHLNTRLVRYSDPHCNTYCNLLTSKVLSNWPHSKTRSYQVRTTAGPKFYAFSLHLLISSYS